MNKFSTIKDHKCSACSIAIMIMIGNVGLELHVLSFDLLLVELPIEIKDKAIAFMKWFVYDG